MNESSYICPKCGTIKAACNNCGMPIKVNDWIIGIFKSSLEGVVAERDEARALVSRSQELACPIQHPEQWIGYQRICQKAVDRWEKK